MPLPPVSRSQYCSRLSNVRTPSNASPPTHLIGSGLANGHFAMSRMKRSSEVTYRRAQDASRAQLHDAAAAGLIQGFAHCYLGMPDARLAVPVADLVPADDLLGYPTNFRAMSESDLNAISFRGEQLTRTLLAHYCPAL